MSERLDGIKQFTIRTGERVFRAQLRQGEQRPGVLLGRLIHPGTPKGDRLEACLHLVGLAVPDFENRLAALIGSTDGFPLKRDELRLLDFGGECTVFLVEIAGERKVMKVDQHSLGLRGRKLIDRALQKREEYQRIRTWYQSVPGFILDEDYFIVHGHLLSLPAVATLQPFIEERIRDFFVDYEADELCAILQGNDFLRAQFLHFVTTLLGRYRNCGDCIDILGPKNLSIVEKRGQPPQMLLLDSHVVYTPELLAERPPETALRIKERINYIGRLFDRVSSQT